MTTIEDQLLELNAGDIKIRNAIIAKGIDLPYATPFIELGDKIGAIPTATPTIDYGWSRPVDRPAVPTVSENEIYLLFGAMPNNPNDFAFSVTVVGGYTVDYGDGETENISSNTTCEHLYYYDDISVTPTIEAIKFVWIKITPTVAGNNITAINHLVRPSWRPAPAASTVFAMNVHEIYMQASEVTGWTWNYSAFTRFAHLEAFHWYGTNKLTSCNAMLAFCPHLKSVELYTGLSVNFGYFLFDAHGINIVDTSWLDTSKVVTATNMGSFFTNLRSFTGTLTIDLLSYTAEWPTTAITAAFCMTGLRFKNMRASQTTLNLNTMSAASLGIGALIDLFNDLYDRTGLSAGIITITGCFGAEWINTADFDFARAIAEQKNWTIVG